MKLVNLDHANSKLALGREVYEVDENGCVEIEASGEVFIDILLKEGWKKLGKIQKVAEKKEDSKKESKKQQEGGAKEASKTKSRKRRKPSFASKGDE